MIGIKISKRPTRGVTKSLKFPVTSTQFDQDDVSRKFNGCNFEKNRSEVREAGTPFHRTQVAMLKLGHGFVQFTEFPSPKNATNPGVFQQTDSSPTALVGGAFHPSPERQCGASLPRRRRRTTVGRRAADGERRADGGGGGGGRHRTTRSSGGRRCGGAGQTTSVTSLPGPGTPSPPPRVVVHGASLDRRPPSTG